MNFKTLFINGNKVNALYINNKKVKMGSETQSTPLCIEKVSGSPTVKLSKLGTPPECSFEYSYDNSTWNTYEIDQEIGLTEQNPKVYFRGDNVKLASASYAHYHKFVMNGGNVKVSGDVNSLLEKENYVGIDLKTHGTYTFSNLFRQCTSIVEVGNIFSSDLLANYCYSYMFWGCSSLTQAPELPATTLATGCYSNMFNGCSSLTQAPELPATTLTTSCYNGMFSGCTSLTQAPELKATTLTDSCYNGMFSGCTSLTQAPELPATSLTGNCYQNMFQGCSSLTQAPELPATTLASGCYNSMFYNCSSLTQAPELPATTLATFCYSYMFQGCSSLTQAPELPATTLANGCYSNMFNGCSNLNEVKVGFKSWGSQTNGWLNGVASTGTFNCPQALIDNTTTRGSNTVPSGWDMVSND